MNEEVVKKLRYKEGKAIVVNPPEGFRLGIETGTDLDEGAYDFLLVFVSSAKETEEWLPRVIPAIKEDAVFWLAYPKSSSKRKTDINRDILWKIVEESTDYRLVSNVAIDETWSALRLRLKDKVKAK
ncbi:hypothetical protein [Paenibacillus flagellatus]|uniref:DUF3052 domain-containing protein n=1 Tax=Paenibacillus flagellatus TaxID=2211139 RepID=A0A2V5K5N7_9BACL|nr:hypothetical protein [Paenibacillus flagellatus]PYI54608.1 hypothetical protein DLM86_14220 [Paenibacillus flagellatus]